MPNCIRRVLSPPQVQSINQSIIHRRRGIRWLKTLFSQRDSPIVRFDFVAVCRFKSISHFTWTTEWSDGVVRRMRGFYCEFNFKTYCFGWESDGRVVRGPGRIHHRSGQGPLIVKDQKFLSELQPMWANCTTLGRRWTRSSVCDSPLPRPGTNSAFLILHWPVAPHAHAFQLALSELDRHRFVVVVSGLEGCVSNILLKVIL